MSDSECDNDSDRELQVAFKKGLLAGKLIQQTEKIVPIKINNKKGLEESLESFKRSLPWVERLDICVEPTALPTCISVESGLTQSEDNIQLENLFYRQAQAAVLQGLPMLRKLSIPTKRPNDYYAEMAKSDAHMSKVKEKLLAIQAIREKADRAKKDRDNRKFQKEASKENKVSKKKEMLKMKDDVKKMKKKINFGKKDDMDEHKKDRKNFKGGNSKPGKDAPNKSGRRTDGPNKSGRRTDGPNKSGGNKRNVRNKKFGFGGQKKRSKSNNKSSFNDF